MLDDTVTKGVDKLGRLIIPIAFRDALNIRRGDALKMSMPKEGELRISRVYNVKGNNILSRQQKISGELHRDGRLDARGTALLCPDGG